MAALISRSPIFLMIGDITPGEAAQRWESLWSPTASSVNPFEIPSNHRLSLADVANETAQPCDRGLTHGLSREVGTPLERVRRPRWD